MLCDFYYFYYAYIDNIVIFSRTLEDYYAYLTAVFDLLDSYNVSLSAKKSFIAFLTVTLLG